MNKNPQVKKVPLEGDLGGCFSIAFDAKRLFHNNTGLGNYSRTLVKGLYTYFPENKYELFTPKPATKAEYDFFAQNFTVHTAPEYMPKSLWRSRFITKDLLRNNVDLYHGLSHELPFGIEKTGIKTVVTIHDLIYKFFPEDFPLIDRKIYEKKWRHSCNNATAIIATSEATKRDIVRYFGTDEKRIHVVYQTCDESFEQRAEPAQIAECKRKLNVPDTYILYVGSVTERKNVLNLVQAYNTVRNTIAMPLVLVGRGGEYFKKVQQYIEQENLQQSVLLRNSISNADLPILYQAAHCFVYPSKYEGFGIPLVEALKSGTPVITSNASCLPEVTGKAALYVNPDSVESIAGALEQMCLHTDTRMNLIEEGAKQAHKFSVRNFVHDTMTVYNLPLNPLKGTFAQ
ncbi:MAG: glycosyltransferase family 4 protein [Bacteroidetes bacterium]|nr:glycosyltransferase family 4 protein [Bacteroidota bacterium]